MDWKWFILAIAVILRWKTTRHQPVQPQVVVIHQEEENREPYPEAVVLFTLEDPDNEAEALSVLNWLGDEYDIGAEN